MRERRQARVGTVSGLALLAGGTGVAAVAGGAHSIFATILLGLLALAMCHALLDEIKRQATRMSPRWARPDTINTVLLGCWAEAALIMSIVPACPVPLRLVGAGLTIGYAVACVSFVTLRRRSVALATRSAGVEASQV